MSDDSIFERFLDGVLGENCDDDLPDLETDVNGNENGGEISFGASCGGTCAADGGHDGWGSKFDFWRAHN